jgi:hypothetical protein
MLLILQCPVLTATLCPEMDNCELYAPLIYTHYKLPYYDHVQGTENNGV